MHQRRFLVGLLLAAIATAAGVVAFAPPGTSPAPPSAPPSARPDAPPSTRPAGVAPPGADPAVAVLRAWDRCRARAWAAGDVEALGALYLRGSAAGRADRRMLAAYVARGLRVSGLRMQYLAVDVRHRGGRRLALVVTDRVVDAVAVGHGHRAELPRDDPSRRLVVLSRVDGRWRVAEVSPP